MRNLQAVSKTRQQGILQLFLHLQTNPFTRFHPFAPCWL